MIVFDFVPTKKIHSSTQRKQSSPIVERGVSGVIHITLDASYYIHIGEVNYPLSKECFNCKDRNILFYKGLYDDNNILKTIRLQKCDKEEIPCYLPFSVGSYCKGDLIKENGEIRFNLKKILKCDKDTKPERVEAIKFFIRNYEELKDKLNL